MRATAAGRFGPGQLVTVELAAMAVAAGVYALPPDRAALAGLAVVPPLLITVGRYHGRWWYEVLGAWLRLRTRRHDRSRAADAARPAGPYWAEIAALAPRLAVQTVIDRNMEIGICADDLGWFGAVALAAQDGLSRSDGSELRLDWLARIAGEPAAPITAVQVVVRHMPLPSAAVDPDSPCARSYQDLRGTLAVPPYRDVWIAVRLGLHDAATVAAERGSDVTSVHRAIAAALSRVSATLTTQGLAHRVLDAAGLQQALVGAYGPDPYEGGPAQVPAASHETWSGWQSTRAVHVCLAVAGWPASAAPRMLFELARVPGALAVCTSVTLGALRSPSGEPGKVGARAVVRVVATPTAIGECLGEIGFAARRLGVRLVRLDGEQAAAVYATTPSAAPYGWSRS